MKDKKLEYWIAFISFLLFSFIFILLILLKLFLIIKWNYSFGLVLGYVFTLISYFLIILSAKLTLKYRSVLIFMFFYFIRLVIYSIPIIIYSKTDHMFNICMIILGLSIIYISEFFLPFLKLDKNSNKSIKKEEILTIKKG